MNYTTIWLREVDGLAHLASVTGNATDGYEIRSLCGLVGNACWEKQLDDDAEITCHRCRAADGEKQTEPQTKPGRPENESHTRNGIIASSPPATSLFAGADLIHAYTRRQAIADGVLVDVTDVAKEAGIRYPTALTRAVWDNFVRVPEGVVGQDEQGRLWDVLWCLRQAARATQGDSTLFYLHVRNDNQGVKRHVLKAICGPGDDASPCLTVLLPNED